MGVINRERVATVIKGRIPSKRGNTPNHRQHPHQKKGEHEPQGEGVHALIREGNRVGNKKPTQKNPPKKPKKKTPKNPLKMFFFLFFGFLIFFYFL
jgi:hypothetical protein